MKLNELGMKKEKKRSSSQKGESCKDSYIMTHFTFFTLNCEIYQLCCRNIVARVK